MRYIEVFKDATPYVMQVPLPNNLDVGDGTLLYDIEVNYNTRHDFYTIGIKQADVTLISGEKLVINRPVNVKGVLAPSVRIIPRNRPGQRGEVNYANMDDTVLLAIEGDEIETMEA